MRHFRDSISKISFFCIISIIFLSFSGCSYTKKTDTNTTNTEDENSSSNSDKLEILSSYYWDFADNNISNDRMYISFTKAVSASSFVSPHLVYNINGAGSIGTGSTYSYWFRDNFSVHTIFLDATSQVPTLNETSISIQSSTIEDLSGYGPEENNPAKVFSLLDYYAFMETGDDTCVKYTVADSVLSVESLDCNDSTVDGTEEYWDINQSIYVDQNFSAQTLLGDKIVKDNVLGLMWEDTNSSLYAYSNAETYCENLNFAGHQDWRIPNMIELQSIINRDRTFPASVATFTTAVNLTQGYWSSDNYVNDNTKQWGIDFNRGMTFFKLKTFQSYVKCVRRDR